jgi:hypothetical protein
MLISPELKMILSSTDFGSTLTTFIMFEKIAFVSLVIVIMVDLLLICKQEVFVLARVGL